MASELLKEFKQDDERLITLVDFPRYPSNMPMRPNTIDRIARNVNTWELQ